MTNESRSTPAMAGTLVLAGMLFGSAWPLAHAGCPPGWVQIGERDVETADAIIVHPLCKEIPALNQANSAASSGSAAVGAASPEAASSTAQYQFDKPGYPMKPVARALAESPTHWKADEWARKLGPAVAGRPEVKAALDAYRNAEQNTQKTRVDLASAERASALDNSIGRKVYADGLRQRLMTDIGDETVARSQVRAALHKLGQTMPATP